MKKIAYDTFKLDQIRIVEDSKCCLKIGAVITKEGVYKYPDGRAFKSRMELLKAANAIRYAGAKIVAFDHPESKVVMSQQHIQGGIEKPFFDRDKIRATLNFDKQRCTTDFLSQVREGVLKDVSIGFYYQPDYTPGKWDGQAYDYVMRDIVIDHIACGVVKGRCSFPECGIGVDTMMMRISTVKIGGDPFGEYESMSDCISKNQHKDDPAAYCAEIHHSITGKWPAEDVTLTKGGRKVMSEEESGQTTPQEFEACVAERVSEGWDEQAAKDYCLAYTTPEDEPIPESPTKPEDVGSTGGAAKQVMAKIERLTTQRETLYKQLAKHPEKRPAIAKQIQNITQALKRYGKDLAEKVSKDQESFDQCVESKMADGMTKEEAEEACRGEQPVAEEDQEVEKTELERCIENKMDEGMTAEEAKSWCEAEQAGEHAEADVLIERSKQLLQLKQQRDVEQLRRQRRQPT